MARRSPLPRGRSLPFVPDLLDENVDPAWGRYLDAWNDGSISRDQRAAGKFRDELRGLGHPVEIVFARALVVPSRPQVEGEGGRQRARSLEWLRRRSQRIEAPPADFMVLGLDVSLPLPDYHSVLVQPGLVEQDGTLADNLNEHGLLSDMGVARQLVEQANSTGYGLGLFSVIEVLGEAIVS